jgi:hypothetical protein
MARAFCRIACEVVYRECVRRYRHRRRFYQTHYVRGMVRDWKQGQSGENMLYSLVNRAYRTGFNKVSLPST